MDSCNTPQPWHTGWDWIRRVHDAAPLIIAHRGGAGLAPENTLGAFRNAVRLGVDAIEFDLQQTSEGFPVVFHDETLDRLTNENGRICEWRWAGLQRSVRIAETEPIPLLEEVCAQMRDTKIRLFVEIKEPSITRETLHVLKEMGWCDRAVIGAFSSDVVDEVSKDAAFPAMQLVKSCDVETLFSAPPQKTKTLAQNFQIAGLAVADATAERVAILHSRGLAVWVWTANTHREIKRAMESGADALISDYPDQCLEILTGHQMVRHLGANTSSSPVGADVRISPTSRAAGPIKSASQPNKFPAAPSKT